MVDILLTPEGLGFKIRVLGLGFSVSVRVRF